jgi:outer membrane lipopolysaccharide assembly protein LptE/RlpB
MFIIGGNFLKKPAIIGLLILLSGLVTACGYRFAGSGSFPEGVSTIYVEVIENRTSKIGAERIVTNQLIFEFSRRRENSLVSKLDEADAILKGSINSIRTQTISRVDTEVANEREVTMAVDLKLIKRDGGAVIWAANGLSDREAFDVVDSKTETDRNEEQAIRRLSERISERIFNRLTDDF